jgi:pimeloyl-ACP methyl ester carboxylesterase
MWRELGSLVGGTWGAPDLPGHGSTPAMGWDAAVAWTAAAAGDARVVIGYSMGGRLALAAALVRPFERLVVVSASAGIADPAEREERRVGDGELADRIEDIGIDAFITEWLARPMFAGLERRSEGWRRADAAMRAGNRPDRLADALRLLGRGVQPYLGDCLNEITASVLLIAGADDPASLRASYGIAKALPNGSIAEVSGAGHGVIGEDPSAVAEVLTGWWGEAPETFTPEHMFD